MVVRAPDVGRVAQHHLILQRLPWRRLRPTHRGLAEIISGTGQEQQTTAENGWCIERPTRRAAGTKRPAFE